MNTTLNQRLALMTQQVIKEQKDVDDNKRQFMEQLNIIRQRIPSDASPPATDVPVQQPPQSGILGPLPASGRRRGIQPILPGLSGHPLRAQGTEAEDALRGRIEGQVPSHAQRRQ
jgi:hypothetical protein